MESQSVNQISECFIKPSHFPENGKQTIHLTQSDLGSLSVHYIQKGLLFKKPPLLLSDAQESSSIQDFLDRLKHSLSVTLVHFYPLAGRLATKITQHPPSYVVYIDCINTPGAKFVHSKLNLSVSDILSPTYVPCIVEHFFDHYKAVNHDGHTLSLLTLKVTELTDGIFFGFSQNHSVADGSSFWKFVNTLSQVFQDEKKIGSELDASNIISPPPYHERWFPDGYGPFYSLPFTHHDQFISRYEGPQLTGRIFHFSAAALGRIKAKANGLCKDRGITISTLQSLSGLVWRCVIRVRGLQKDEISSCRTSVNIRSRLEPPLPPNYYGNCIQTVAAVTTAGELLENDLGWAAAQLTEAITKHDDKAARETLMKWLQNPSIYQIKHLVNPGLVMFGSSPRFNMYGNEFGLGKAVGVLSGHDNKFDGKGTLYQGRQGGGSIDVDLCLLSHSMSALERDEEFLDALHFSNQSEYQTILRACLERPEAASGFLTGKKSQKEKEESRSMTDPNRHSEGSTSGIKSCEFSVWSREQNNIFEIGIAIYSEDLEDRWEKIAAHIPGKSVQDIKQHYKILLDDLDLIEFGYYDFCFSDLNGVLGSEEIGEKGGNDCVPLHDFSLNDINELLGNEEIDEKGGNGCVPPSDYDFSFNGLTGALGNEEIGEKGGNGCVPLPDYDFSFNDLTGVLGNEEIGEKGGNGCVPLPDYDFSSNGLIGTLGNEEIDKKGGNVRQFGVDGGKSSWAEQKGRKGVPWTEDEHRLFLQGLDKYGKGDWRSISRFCVVTRTPAQVASHAQKYYLRLSTANNKGKRRTSIHDITDGNTNGKPSQQATPPSLAASSEVGQYDTMELPGSSWTNSFRYPSC